MNNASISFNDFKNASQKSVDEVKKLKFTPKVDLTVEDDVVEINSNLTDELKAAKNQNGLIEKVADKIKGLINFGYSSKKIEQEIKDGKNSQEVEKDIKNYRRSQENTAQTVADVATSAASIFALFKVKNTAQIFQKKCLGFNEKLIDNIIKDIPEKAKIDPKKVAEILKNQKTALALGVVAATIVGAFVKSNLLKLNRIGTKQYKPEITKDMDKASMKKAKKEARKAKANADFRNKISGAITGLTSPLIATFGVAGAIGHAAINLFNRYFIASREDRKQKSVNGFVENLKASLVVNALGAVAILIPAIKSGKANKVFEQNLQKAFDKLKNAQLQEISSGKTSYEELYDVLFENPTRIREIANDSRLTTSQKIQALSEENIFALKFKQITSNSDELAKALKTDCPVTRTIEEAQQEIGQVFGSKYQVQRCVGVGTVAETYVAKDESGKEVCIKILKKGIDEAKIEGDKAKFIDMIKALPDKTAEEKQYLIDNITSIADGVKKEVDFSNELKAAQTLKGVTRQANVVVPIEVKDNMYVMEKANGVSLQTLMRYLDKDKLLEDAKYYKERLAECKDKNGWEFEFYSNRLKMAEQKIADLEAMTKDLDGVGEITMEEAKQLLQKYQDVLIEQFSEVSEKGKTIHGDIHPGNIFVDINAMRKGEKFFTLIDTGNVINQDPQMAIRFLNLSSYIKNADVENIAKFVLEGAKLPEGMSKEAATEKIIEALNSAFFDNKTAIGPVTNDSILAITDGIMQNLKIIPADTQGNLMKAKTSAKQSSDEFSKAFFESLMKRVRNNIEAKGEENVNAADVAIESAKIVKEITELQAKYMAKKALQERKNLAMLSPALRASIKKSASVHSKNSEEYLTYSLKQAVNSKINSID